VPVLRPPVSCCLSAVGLGLLGHPAPAGELSLPCGRPTGHHVTGPQRGCRVAHEQAATGQGALFIPGTVVRSRPAITFRPARAALPQPVPTAPLEHPIGGGTFTRRQREFTLFTHHPRPGWLPAQGREPRLQAPAGLLLARGPRMEQGPLRLLPRASHPAITRDARRGGDRPSRTGPGTTPPASAGPPTVPSTHTHAPSRRT
jgi:hypothetical protein